ncbi:MAG: hypothetical protein Q4G60_04375 [bacterium]|nr:hypothetical protein [bacterium]
MLCGWLSPDGDFYPCGPYEHIHLAGELTNAHYPDTGHVSDFISDDYLLDEKWIKLFCDGLAIGNFLKLKERYRTHSTGLITKKQINWILERQHLLSSKQERCLSMYLELENL